MSETGQRHYLTTMAMGDGSVRQFRHVNTSGELARDHARHHAGVCGGTVTGTRQITAAEEAEIDRVEVQAA